MLPTILASQNTTEDPANSMWLIAPMLDAMEDTQQRSAWTWDHLGRVSRYALVFGREVGLRGESLLILQCASILHDIGKLAIPSELLDKETPLERDEWYAITKHPVASSKMLRAQNLRVEVISAAQSHHEWYNGKGYPLGLAGEAIPLAARVLSIADAYDAMSSDRPYRAALSPARIKDEIVKGAGVQFDPGLVRDLLPLLEAGVESSLPQLRMRVLSDDPALLAELWFGSYPLGWDIEAWPPGWSGQLAGADPAPDVHIARPSHARPDLTVIDGRSYRRLPEGLLEGITGPVLWVDPPGGALDEAPADALVMTRPLDLASLHTTLNASLYENTRTKRKTAALRVLIADPYHLFRQVLRRALDERGDVRVVAEVATPLEYRDAGRNPEYDVAIVASDLLVGTHSTSPLSLTGGRLDRNEAGIYAGGSKPAIVLVADEDLQEFTDGGAMTTSGRPSTLYIHRGAPIEELVDALQAVARGF